MKRILLAACLVALCGRAEAQQQVIIGNSVAAPYQTGTNFGTKSVGFFTGSSALLLEDIQVALGGTAGGGGTLTFTLNADNAGVPGGVIAQIGSATVVGFAPTAAFTITPSQPLLLNPTTVYWIQAVFPSSGGSADWDRTNPQIAPSSPSGLAAFVGYNFNGGPSSTFNAIIVDGTITSGGGVAKTSGTAARAIVTGSRCGQAITPVDKIAGGLGVDGFSDALADHVGSIAAVGSVPSTGPRVGALVATDNFVEAATGIPLGVGVGGARAIAYGKYRNDTNVNQTPPAFATLDGDFFTQPSVTLKVGLCADVDTNVSGSPGHATAAVYVFDAVTFVDALNNAGKTMPEFLLGDDELKDYQIGTASALSLTRFSSLSAALIAQDFRQVDPATFSSGTTIGPTLITVAPGQSVIVVFDITAYSPPGARVRFINTLKPAPGFMTNMTAVGPWTPGAPSAASLTLSPAATTNPITTPVTVTATATTASGAPVPKTLVFFDITGPNAQPLAPAMTDAQGQATLTYPGGGIAGTDVIEATIGTLQSNFAQLTWTSPGPLDHIRVSPASATIQAGGSQSYTAESQDVFDHSIGDVTSSTTFTISPDGSCTGAACTATITGPHTVTGTYNGKTATAALNVTSSTYAFQGFFQPIDMSTSSLVVWNAVKAGQSVPIKWVLTLNAVPVSDPASFAGVSSYPIACSSGSGSVDDAIDQTATGNSGLQDNGGGNWQFNWQTLSSYKNSCRAVVVKFSDGTVSPAALFKFR